MKRLSVVVLALLVLTGCTSAPAAEPTPETTATVTQDAPATPAVSPAPVDEAVTAPPAVTLTDAQRATLDTTFGTSLGENSLLKTYCPMDDSGRSYYAKLIASQLEGFTEAMVMQYLADVC